MTTRDEMIEAMARGIMTAAWSRIGGQCDVADDRCEHGDCPCSDVAMMSAEAALSAIEAAGLVVVRMDDALRNHLSIARMCQPIRTYPGTGSLWFGRNDELPDADFRDWGAARAFACIVAAMIAAATGGEP
jgi:hypothetical protein